MSKKVIRSRFLPDQHPSTKFHVNSGHSFCRNQYLTKHNGPVVKTHLNSLEPEFELDLHQIGHTLSTKQWLIFSITIHELLSEKSSTMLNNSLSLMFLTPCPLLPSSSVKISPVVFVITNKWTGVKTWQQVGKETSWWSASVVNPLVRAAPVLPHAEAERLRKEAEQSHTNGFFHASS